MRLAVVAAAAATAATTLACQAEFRDYYGAPAEPPVAATQAPAAAPQIVAITPTVHPAAAPATAAAGSLPPVTSSAPATSAAPPAAETAPTPGPVPASGAATSAITGTISVRPQALAYNGANVVVWLDDPPSQPPASDAGATATLDQHGMAFIPILTVVRAGGKILFLNQDPFPHNIFTPDHEKFNLGTMPHGATVSRQFDQPGHYALLCNLHPNMLAYILVTPSSWFAHPDKEGKFALTGVPAGTYTLKAWGGRLGEQSRTVTVNGADVAIDFHLQQAD